MKIEILVIEQTEFDINGIIILTPIENLTIRQLKISFYQQEQDNKNNVLTTIFKLSKILLIDKLVGQRQQLDFHFQVPPEILPNYDNKLGHSTCELLVQVDVFNHCILNKSQQIIPIKTNRPIKIAREEKLKNMNVYVAFNYDKNNLRFEITLINSSKYDINNIQLIFSEIFSKDGQHLKQILFTQKLDVIIQGKSSYFIQGEIEDVKLQQFVGIIEKYHQFQVQLDQKKFIQKHMKAKFQIN